MIRLVGTLLALCLGVSAAAAEGTPRQGAILSRDAEVVGIKLHYLTAGKGPAVILIHGYTQTSRM